MAYSEKADDLDECSDISEEELSDMDEQDGAGSGSAEVKSPPLSAASTVSPLSTDTATSGTLRHSTPGSEAGSGANTPPPRTEDGAAPSEASSSGGGGPT